MKPEHLPLLKSVSAPAVHPDGTRAVVSVTRPDFDADAYVGQLWSVPQDPEKRPRLITRGFRDTAPAFSPDGRVLAFLRAAAGGKPQLHVVEAAGGEPQVLTDRALGVSSFAWSPDSQRIVFGSREPEAGRYGTLDGVSSGGEDARLITDYKYRMNGVGYTRGQAAAGFHAGGARSGRGAGSPAGGALPSGARDKRAGRCRGKGGRACSRRPAAHYGSDRPHRRVLQQRRNFRVLRRSPSRRQRPGPGHRVYRVPADGGEPVCVQAANAGLQTVQDARESWDGQWLFFTAQDLGGTGQDFVAKNTVLHVMPAAGGDARALSDAETWTLRRRAAGLNSAEATAPWS